MSDLNSFYGPNAAYVLDLYERFRDDPNSVDAATRALFETWNPQPPAYREWKSEEVALHSCGPAEIPCVVATAKLARLIRELGHLAAHIDPLGSPPPGDPALEMSTHGLTESDLRALPASIVGPPLSEGARDALEAMRRLYAVYSGAVGYETDHVQNPEERQWLRDSIESGCFIPNLDNGAKRDLLARLTEVDTFEQYLHRTFQGVKRFSIEGSDMLVPVLDEIIKYAAQAGTREVVIGMAHRGRLNVMAHVLGKPYSAILPGFEKITWEESSAVSGRNSLGWTGDVKYHLGHMRNFERIGIEQMPITLVPNPSHLEFVNPVVEGHVRAAQERRSIRGRPVQDDRAAVAILIHGDSAFPGQGIVAETLNLSRLSGYRTGGTIHIIANNQIGFTTLPSDARSTLYAGDLAKGFEIPIVHVNADDPVACQTVARMAAAYRDKFRKDFLIDLIGYRRHGHNENDEAGYTQPETTERIRRHPRLREIWAQKLEAAGIVSKAEADAMVADVQNHLKQARETPGSHSELESDLYARPARTRKVDTAVPMEKLVDLNTSLLVFPEDFKPHPKLEDLLKRRKDNLRKEGGIDWAHAESLAFASILSDGIPIRLTGQDSERGTFSQRHLVLHDIRNDARYVPLESFRAAHASFSVYNSPLSENATVGFEYGYSMHAPGVLVLWEGQFGDFVNGAQVIIDQFLVSGNAKWRQIPSLVLLLPHGYEGQGPDHSSARLERFLQLAANDNIRVVNCSTAAQYFHLLRRQAALLKTDPRPLIVMTPKSMLRSPQASSSLEELAGDNFHAVIDDDGARERADRVTRLVLCSGKVYWNLLASKSYTESEDTERLAIARVEELYPFPAEEIKRVIAGYPRLQEVAWLQEEPCNMGAWTFVAPRITGPELVGWQGRLLYCGRPEAASPSEGSERLHIVEQSRLLASAMREIPDISPVLPIEPLKRSEVSHAS